MPFLVRVQAFVQLEQRIQQNPNMITVLFKVYTRIHHILLIPYSFFVILFTLFPP